MTRDGVIGAAVAAGVAAALAAGFLAIGSPGHRRSVEMDKRRSADVRAIAAAVQVRYSRQGSLPRRLADVSSLGADTFDPLRDPVTRRPYAYAPLGGPSYRVCLRYDTALRRDDAGWLDYHGGFGGDWEHPAGEICYRLDARYGIAQTPSEPPPTVPAGAPTSPPTAAARRS